MATAHAGLSSQTGYNTVHRSQSGRFLSWFSVPLPSSPPSPLCLVCHRQSLPTSRHHQNQYWSPGSATLHLLGAILSISRLILGTRSLRSETVFQAIPAAQGRIHTVARAEWSQAKGWHKLAIACVVLAFRSRTGLFEASSLRELLLGQVDGSVQFACNVLLGQMTLDA